MSERLAAAAQAMRVPEAIVERSARAWAAASGADVDEVLASWAGDGSIPAPSSPTAPPPEESTTPESAPTAPAPAAEPASAPEPTSAPSPVSAPAQSPVAAMVAPSEPEVDPLPLGARLRLAGRIGSWTGAILGLIGLVMAGSWLLGAASVVGAEGAFGPAVEVGRVGFLVGVSLFSVVFGMTVAALSRAAAAWVDPGARLDGRHATTVAMGAGLGLVLGLAAGAVMLSGFAEAVEGEEPISILPVIPSVFVVVLGGALLGWLTASLVQLVGVPAVVEEADQAEIAEVRSRFRAALAIPLTAVALLALLVLPLGMVFLRSNALASGGAAVLAIIAAGAVLGIAAIVGSRPNMRVRFGEVVVAILGIATVIVIIVAVIQAQNPPVEHATGEVTESH